MEIKNQFQIESFLIFCMCVWHLCVWFERRIIESKSLLGTWAVEADIKDTSCPVGVEEWWKL